MKAAWAEAFSSRLSGELYARYSIFACVHCSWCGGGNKALSLSRNNVPLSIRAWNNWLQPSARIGIIDHVCDVCPDIDIESLFNTDEWLPLDGTVEIFFFPLSFFSFFFFFHSRDRDLAARLWRLLGQRAGESSARFTSGLLSIRHHLDRLLPFDSCLRPTETHWLEKVIRLRPSAFEYLETSIEYKLGEWDFVSILIFDITWSLTIKHSWVIVNKSCLEGFVFFFIRIRYCFGKYFVQAWWDWIKIEHFIISSIRWHFTPKNISFFLMVWE